MKRLTPDQFQAAIEGLELSQQTLEIAEGVLVHGKKQVEFVSSHNLTKGAVSQAVERVYSRANTLPVGFEKVTAVLPEQQAFIVKKWAAEAKARATKK